MEISIRKICDAGICVALPMSSSIPHVKLWKERIVTDMLLMAFSNRPATLISVDPSPDAIGYQFPHQMVVSGGKSYLVNNMQCCDYQDLVKTGESPEMCSGLLTVVAGAGNYQFKSYFTHTEAELSALKDEFFICSPDGYRIYWLNANRAYPGLLDAINDIANFYEIVTAS